MQKVYVTQDGDSHWYVIPFELRDDFIVLLEECEKKDDYYDFENKFAEYRTGGALNLVQLYAEL